MDDLVSRIPRRRKLVDSMISNSHPTIAKFPSVFVQMMVSLKFHVMSGLVTSTVRMNSNRTPDMIVTLYPLVSPRSKRYPIQSNNLQYTQ